VQTFNNKAPKEKQAAAGEGREPGQFQTLAPVAAASSAREAKRIKMAEWAEIEAKVIELFDFQDCNASPDAQGRPVVEICAGESKAVGTATGVGRQVRSGQDRQVRSGILLCQNLGP
jgi:hypothetical protein